MGRAWLFNPENDITLALDVEGYTPARNVKLLHVAGAEMPLWLADAGDTVIAFDRDSEWEKSVKNLYGLAGQCAGTVSGDVTHACPWGWSRNAVWQLERAGVPAEILPGEFKLAELRELSHRRTAIEINRRLANKLDMPLPPPAIEAASLSEVEEAIGRFGGEAILKSPWSSTGRGVTDTRLMQRANVLSIAEAAIRRQKSVLVEKALDNRCDFAMLFEAREGKVNFVGYSLFETNGTAYTGNLMLPDDEIEARLAAMVGERPLRQVRESLPDILSEVLGGAYEGFFGADMLVYADGGTLRMAPCIEVNLRMTMGVYAWLWRQRFIADGSRGVMRVTFGKNAGFAPAEIKAGRLVSGTQLLTPDRSHLAACPVIFVNAEAATR